jgi:hypothetical protein
MTDDDPAIDNDDERADDNCGNDDGNIPEDSHHRFRCRENLKYHLSQLVEKLLGGHTKTQTS